MTNVERDQYCGQVLNDRYRVVAWLGRGGMGSVYLGTHMLIGRTLAIKILNDELIGNEIMTARFYREARTASSVGHKNIIEIFDVGVTSKGNPFLVMEFLEGESLGSLLSRMGPLDLGLACGILEPVLQALSAAHNKGVIHRDLKPDNIFLAYQEHGPPIVKLIDFGISKILVGNQAQMELSQPGVALGSPHYMSPEQILEFDNVDSRADIYSVGAILYKILTGKGPFLETRIPAVFYAVISSEPIDPNESYSDFPDVAKLTVMKALSKSPEDRFQTAGEMLENLRELDLLNRRQTHMANLIKPDTGLSYGVGSFGLELKNPCIGTREVPATALGETARGIVEVQAENLGQQTTNKDSLSLLLPSEYTRVDRRRNWRFLAIPAVALFVLGLIFVPGFFPRKDGESTDKQEVARTNIIQLPSAREPAQPTNVPDEVTEDGVAMKPLSAREVSQTTKKHQAAIGATVKKKTRPKKLYRRKKSLAVTPKPLLRKGKKGTEFMEEFD